MSTINYSVMALITLTFSLQASIPGEEILCAFTPSTPETSIPSDGGYCGNHPTTQKTNIIVKNIPVSIPETAVYQAEELEDEPLFHTPYCIHVTDHTTAQMYLNSIAERLLTSPLSGLMGKHFDDRARYSLKYAQGNLLMVSKEVKAGNKTLPRLVATFRVPPLRENICSLFGGLRVSFINHPIGTVYPPLVRENKDHETAVEQIRHNLSMYLFVAKKKSWLPARVHQDIFTPCETYLLANMPRFTQDEQIFKTVLHAFIASDIWDLRILSQNRLKVCVEKLIAGYITRYTAENQHLDIDMQQLHQCLYQWVYLAKASVKKDRIPVSTPVSIRPLTAAPVAPLSINTAPQDAPQATIVTLPPHAENCPAVPNRSASHDQE